MEKKNIERKEIKNVIAQAIEFGMKSVCDAKNQVFVLDITLHNWVSGFSKKWVRNELVIYTDRNNWYEITDREVTNTFLNIIIEEQLKLKGAKAIINYYQDATTIRGITFFGTPCEDFLEVQRILKEQTRRTLDVSKVFHVCVCGKRSAWDDTDRKKYLAYDEKTSKALLNYVKEHDIIKFETIDYFSHGDSVDYNYAMYAETEWYGCRGTYLKLTTKDNKTRTYYLQE